jgi:hypothetical protein
MTRRFGLVILVVCAIAPGLALAGEPLVFEPTVVTAPTPKPEVQILLPRVDVVTPYNVALDKALTDKIVGAAEQKPL